jgi:hypothetical protein
MSRSPLPKGILGDPHLAHMIASSVPSSRRLRRSESVRPPKLNTRSVVAHSVMWIVVVVSTIFSYFISSWREEGVYRGTTGRVREHVLCEKKNESRKTEGTIEVLSVDG